MPSLGAMESMRSTWTDSRLDDLNGRVTELSGRIDNLQHTMVQAVVAITATMITGFLGLAGFIATQV
jgi:TolA-binding protein